MHGLGGIRTPYYIISPFDIEMAVAGRVAMAIWMSSTPRSIT